MLKLRENVPPPIPEPLTPEAVAALFIRIRAELGLQVITQADAGYTSKQWARWPRATNDDMRAL